MSEQYLPLQHKPTIYAYTEQQYRNRPWTGTRQGKGLLKVGYTTRPVAVRMAEHYPTIRPDKIPYRVVLEQPALRDDGTFFTDHDVHAALKKMKVKCAAGEWYECTASEVESAILAVRKRKSPVEQLRYDFAMRPEQRKAVELTKAYFEKFATENGTSRTPHFLWNAKMRFGKTFTTYQLAKTMSWKKILVLTFKPAVHNAWEDDLKSHVDFKGWQFISQNTVDDPSEAFRNRDTSKPVVWFASFQDMLGKTDVGGMKAHNAEAHGTNWDCIVLDEYHFGAWRETAKDLYDAEDKREAAFVDGEGRDYFDEELMPLTTYHYLYLSGTPFRAINTGEFLEDQIFNWTYSDEQRAKEEWREADGPNPYAELPQMILMTYQMPPEIREVALKGEFNEFDLNEFFKADKVPGKDEYRFKYEDSVQKWLDLLRGQYLPSAIDALKTKERPPMPFSDGRLLDTLCHTFWFLPSVASCHAMAQLMAKKGNSFFHDYTVIVCAGTEAGIGVKALGPVIDSIGNPLKTKTITLSCGKLTTGVTVPPWSGIFMLRSTTSPEAYFQAAFRVQSPWKVRNPEGDAANKVEIIKPVCYVFDYAPDRALGEIAEYSARLDVNSTQTPEQRVEEFIKFLPVLCFDGSSMRSLNAGEILDLVISGTASTMLARRWESALLVNVDNDTLQRLINSPEAMEALSRIEGFRGLRDTIDTIINRSDALKKLKKERSESGEKVDKKEKKELSDEEKEIKSKRKEIQEKLMKFATRIPVFMYLTDYREQTLKDVITQLETKLFTRVTGLSLADFELLVSLGVFNAELMNSAIFAFKRYEDASLSYTGLNRHAGEMVGGWDTALTSVEAAAQVKL